MLLFTATIRFHNLKSSSQIELTIDRQNYLIIKVPVEKKSIKYTHHMIRKQKLVFQEPC